MEFLDLPEIRKILKRISDLTDDSARFNIETSYVPAIGFETTYFIYCYPYQYETDCEEDALEYLKKTEAYLVRKKKRPKSKMMGAQNAIKEDDNVG